MDGFRAFRLGNVEYRKALTAQLRFLEMRRRGEIEDVLLLLEHPPTFTMGKAGRMENVRIDRAELRSRGIHFEVISRGGDITYHGPGQIVGYPIIDLKRFGPDVRGYLRRIEDMLMLSLKDFGIRSHRVEELIGVWVEGEKIASIGVGIKRWITYHGFALNVNTDLSYFELINPCGLNSVKMTSMERVLGAKDGIDMSTVEESLIGAFGKVFGRKLISVSYQIDSPEAGNIT